MRKVLRRWLNAVFTTILNAFSSQPSSVRPLRRRRITADCTLGGGAKAPEPTLKM